MKHEVEFNTSQAYVAYREHQEGMQARAEAEAQAQDEQQSQITLYEVETAWADSVGAADWYERCSTTRGVDKRTIAEAKRRMLETADYAEKLQDLYNEQQTELEHKRVMMTSVNGRVQLNPAWCKHGDTVLNTSGGHHFSAGEVWDDIHEEVYCLDCGTVIEDEPQGDSDIEGDETFGGER